MFLINIELYQSLQPNPAFPQVSSVPPQIDILHFLDYIGLNSEDSQPINHFTCTCYGFSTLRNTMFSDFKVKY